MIFFKELPTDEQAVENLFARLKADTSRGPGPGFTDEQLRDIVDKGCVLALATLRDMDDKLRGTVTGMHEADADVVQSIALTMMNMVIKSSVEALMLQSFFNVLFGRRPS